MLSVDDFEGDDTMGLSRFDVLVVVGAVALVKYYEKKKLMKETETEKKNDTVEGDGGYEGERLVKERFSRKSSIFVVHGMTKEERLRGGKALKKPAAEESSLSKKQSFTMLDQSFINNFSCPLDFLKKRRSNRGTLKRTVENQGDMKGLKYWFESENGEEEAAELRKKMTKDMPIGGSKHKGFSESETSEEEGMKLKRRKKDKPTGLHPPTNLPEEFRNPITAMGDTDLKLVIHKLLFETDVKKTHNRLSMPLNQVKGEFSQIGRKQCWV